MIQKTFTRFTLDSLGINPQTSSADELSAVFSRRDEAELTEKTIEIILDRFPEFFDNKKIIVSDFDIAHFAFKVNFGFGHPSTVSTN